MKTNSVDAFLDKILPIGIIVFISDNSSVPSHGSWQKIATLKEGAVIGFNGRSYNESLDGNCPPHEHAVAYETLIKMVDRDDAFDGSNWTPITFQSSPLATTNSNFTYDPEDLLKKRNNMRNYSLDLTFNMTTTDTYIDTGASIDQNRSNFNNVRQTSMGHTVYIWQRTS